MRRSLAALFGLAAATAAVVPPRIARAQRGPGAPDSAGQPPPINDNSFLVEEAYNQDRGVVQHILSFSRPGGGPGWEATFTQEWPVGGRTHQLSYTLPEVHPDAPHAAPRPGDVALNYRYQLRDRGGVFVAPRATLVLPTGSARAGAGQGGVGYQTLVPATFELGPHWSAHANVGGTLVPRGRDDDGARDRATTGTLAGSVIWLARPTVNVLLETQWTETVTRPAGGPREVETERVVSPGVRYAFNFASGAQVVPGVAAPLTLHGTARHPSADVGAFVYLSVEHAFGRTR